MATSSAAQKAKANTVRGVGRPKLGSYRLETILPQQVLAELIRHENATGVYRTRIAAAVLCDWAKNNGDAHKSSGSR